MNLLLKHEKKTDNNKYIYIRHIIKEENERGKREMTGEAQNKLTKHNVNLSRDLYRSETGLVRNS